MESKTNTKVLITLPEEEEDEDGTDQESYFDEKAWDPMRDDFESIQNLHGANFNDPLYRLTGVKTQEDVACKFHDGFAGQCFKGPRCRFKHEKYTGGVFKKNFPNYENYQEANKVAVTLYNNLPDKPIIRCNSIFNGKVLKIVSPHQFYVLPDNLSCLCEHESVDKLLPSQQLFAECGKIGYERLTYDIMEAWPKLIQATHYLENEIIVVKAKDTEGATTFQRALVKEDFQFDDHLPLKAPLIKYDFVDFPGSGTASMKEVARLPSKLAIFPPLIYCFSLYGIFPVNANWSTRSVNWFNDKFLHQTVRFIIQKEAIINQDTMIFEEKHPYQVKMICDDRETTEEMKSVDIQMATKGLGILWNPSSARPLVTKALNIQPSYFIYLKPKLNDEVVDHIYNQELQRLKKNDKIRMNRADEDDVTSEPSVGHFDNETKKLEIEKWMSDASQILIKRRCDFPKRGNSPHFPRS